MKHSVKHLRFPEAAVETVAEFRQVAWQMLGADAMVDAPDIASRTAKALWPPQAKQMFLTGFLRTELFLKLHQAEGFLLHRHAPSS